MRMVFHGVEDETHDVGDGVGCGSQAVVAHVGDEMCQRRHHSQVDDILQYRIQSVPTLMLFRNGEVLWRTSGVVDKAELLATLDPFLI